MEIEVLILLIILILVVLILLYLEPVILKQKIYNNNEYGSARFSKFSDIKTNFKKERVNNIKRVGIPVWYSKNLKYVWFDMETPHYTYLGSTGSGKSVTAVIPMCSFLATAKKKRSVFITDPKGEIFNATSKMFKDNNYNVITLDFRNPELSNHFNILEPIIKEYEKYIVYENNYKKGIKKDQNINLSMSSLAETNRLITSLATMIMQDSKQTKDPFWNNSARNLLEGLIGFFLEEYKLGNIKKEQITMTGIRKFQNSLMNDKNFNKFKIYLNRKEYGNKSKDSLTSILSSSENTYKSITSVFAEKMAIFDDINVCNVTSDSDFDLDVLGKKETALYIIVPDEDKTYFTLITIIVGLLYKELVKLANNQENKKIPVEVDWLLDEFANCPPLADIESLVSVSRSRGMRFHFFIQSFSQLDNVYGKDVAQIILDNCGLIYLKTNTQATAEQISKRLGKKTISNNSISQSINKREVNGNRSTSLIARDLLTPDEVKQLHYKTIIFPIIGYPIIRDTVIYSKLSCYKKGCVKRRAKSLKNFDSTYYTSEQIVLNNVDSVDDSNEFLREQEEAEKQLLLVALEKIKSIMKNLNINYKYKACNGKCYLIIYLDNKLNKLEETLIKGKINSEIYHLIFDIETIEIHLKNPLEQKLNIERENKNVV